ARSEGEADPSWSGHCVPPLTGVAGAGLAVAGAGDSILTSVKPASSTASASFMGEGRCFASRLSRTLPWERSTVTAETPVTRRSWLPMLLEQRGQPRPLT